MHIAEKLNHVEWNKFMSSYNVLIAFTLQKHIKRNKFMKFVIKFRYTVQMVVGQHNIEKEKKTLVISWTDLGKLLVNWKH